MLQFPFFSPDLENFAVAAYFSGERYMQFRCPFMILGHGKLGVSRETTNNCTEIILTTGVPI